eukprot:s772_g10.t1
MASWPDFIKAAETVEPEGAVIDAVASIFKDKLKATVPVQAEGISEEALNAVISDVDPPVMALARRTLRNVEAAAVARRTQATSTSLLNAATGSSAKLLANALSPSKTVDVADKLKTHHLQDLGYHLQADQSLFDLLVAHTEEAKRASRTPFAFVDLTSKECLPLWIPLDSVGGRFAVRDEEDVALTSSSPISNLGDLSKALKGATSAPRFFRSVQQWSAAFWRWATAAISAEHWQMAQALAHHDIILQLAEQERLKSKPPYAAFLYDEMLRRQWSRRAEKRDPTFDLKSEAQKLDKDLLEVVHQRLATVLRQAGIESQAAGRDQAVLSQQMASAEAAQKKAEQVQKSLAEAQRNILAKAQATSPDASQDGTGKSECCPALFDAVLQLSPSSGQLHVRPACDLPPVQQSCLSQLQGESLVPHGLGAKKGLMPLEHVRFAVTVPHPSEKGADLSQEVCEAIEFECRQSPAQVDSFRRDILARIIRFHSLCSQEHEGWVRQAPVALQPLVASIHGPLWKVLLKEVPVSSSLFLQNLQQGFPLVGHLPPCEGESVPHVHPAVATVEELKHARRRLNETVIKAVKQLPFSEDVLPQVLDDAEQHFITSPRALVPDDLLDKSLTRRIPVREERAKGWRTRVVDHETESGVNSATTPGILLTAQHKGMPFGTVSAVYAWHRVSYFLSAILLHVFRCPVARYVDDFFAAYRKGLTYHAGRVLSIISRLLGFPTDDAKDADDAIQMVCLGAEVEAWFSTRQLRTQVDQSKAATRKYISSLRSFLALGVLTPGEASKLAGRLSFSVTVSGNRVGRACIKPFHAQAHSPLPGFAISPLLRSCAHWFVQYLTFCPTSVRSLAKHDRTKVISWSDAAGQSRWVATVVFHNGNFWWTRIRTPHEVWRALLPRQDSQIQFQELLGVLLTWGTFRSLLKGSLWVAFVDNDSILHTITKGSGGGAEVHLCVGHLWLELAAGQVDLHLARVESAANISDGPTREDLSLLAMLKATWVEPVLPKWVSDFWQGPSNL